MIVALPLAELAFWSGSPALAVGAGEGAGKRVRAGRRGALGRNTQGEAVAGVATASPCATMYAACFAFQQIYARIRAVQRGLTDMGAPRELVSGATGAPLPTRRICSRAPGRRPGPAVPSDAGNGAAPLPVITASPCGDRSRGGGRSPTTTGPTSPGTASASRGGRWGGRAFFFCNGCVVSASVLPQDGCNLPPIAMYGAVRRARLPAGTVSLLRLRACRIPARPSASPSH